MDHMDEHLTMAATGCDYPLAIKAALAIGKKTLNHYYNQTDHSVVYSIAMSKCFFYFMIFDLYLYLYLYIVLHPQHKLEYYISRRPDGKKNRLIRQKRLSVQNLTR